VLSPFELIQFEIFQMDYKPFSLSVATFDFIHRFTFLVTVSTLLKEVALKSMTSLSSNGVLPWKFSEVVGYFLFPVDASSTTSHTVYESWLASHPLPERYSA